MRVPQWTAKPMDIKWDRRDELEAANVGATPTPWLSVDRHGICLSTRGGSPLLVARGVRMSDSGERSVPLYEP